MVIDTKYMRELVTMCANLGWIRMEECRVTGMLDEIDRLRAKLAKAAKPSASYPPDFAEAYAAGVKWRAGSTQKAAFIQWQHRINASAAPTETAAQMIAGARDYARYCAATGSEKKMAQTFFGPGEHYTADWSTSAPPGRAGKFDPVAHVNKNRAGEAWNDGFIDINPR